MMVFGTVKEAEVGVGISGVGLEAGAAARLARGRPAEMRMWDISMVGSPTRADVERRWEEPGASRWVQRAAEYKKA